MYYIGPFIQNGNNFDLPEGATVALSITKDIALFQTNSRLSSDYLRFTDTLSPNDRSLLCSFLNINLVNEPDIFKFIFQVLALQGSYEGPIYNLMPNVKRKMELHFGNKILEYTFKPNIYPRVKDRIRDNYKKLYHGDISRASFIRTLIDNDPPIGKDRLLYNEVKRVSRHSRLTFNDARELVAIKNENLHRQYLSCMEKKTKIRYQELIHPSLPIERPLREGTSYTESFDTADSDTLGPDLTWNELYGDVDIVSNRASPEASASCARAEHDLSTDDMYAQVDTSGFVNQPRVMARISGTPTGYSFQASGVLHRFSTFSYTSLGTSSAVNTFMQCKCDGSTIQGIDSTGIKVSVTDTTYSGEVRGGLGGNAGASDVDNFIEEDLVAATNFNINTSLNNESNYRRKTYVHNLWEPFNSPAAPESINYIAPTWMENNRESVFKNPVYEHTLFQPARASLINQPQGNLPVIDKRMERISVAYRSRQEQVRRKVAKR